MEIVRLTTENKEAWNKFCQASDMAWFWNTEEWINLILNYIPDLKTRNLSFLVIEKGKIIAIVPLTIENYKIDKKEINEFSFGGWFIPAPAPDNALNDEEKDNIYKFIFDQIDRLAVENRISRARFIQSPLSLACLNKKINLDYFEIFGYYAAGLTTQVINLSLAENQLWKNLRRNHRRNILKGENLKIHFYNSENINKEIFQAYKEMHHKAAGRQTRPGITYEYMYNWLLQGFGFLAVAEFEEKKIGFEYYSVYKNNVYAFSASNDPDYKELPIRHFLEWQAILWMKKKGFFYYEIGHQPFINPTEKQINIALFKEGFGGEIIPLIAVEKRY